MKGALVVDWENLQLSLKQRGYGVATDLLARSLKAKALDSAAAENASLDRLEVYASAAAFGAPALQEVWLRTGYSVHPTSPDIDACQQEIYADLLTFLHAGGFGFFVIAAGVSSYGILRRRLETSGAKCRVWVMEKTEGSEDLLLPTLLQIPHQNLRPKLQSPPLSSFEGVARLIEGEITRRVQRQLDRESRRYSTAGTVTLAFTSLVNKLSAADFTPDVVVSWTDESRRWNGSETVARDLAARMKLPVVRIEVREEGEQREVLSLPDLPGRRRALLVDDAAFSGKTLAMLVSSLHERFPGCEFRTAVLSAQVPTASSIDFYGDTHAGQDVLFPWGWARTIDKLYDLFRQLGIRDKRWMPRRLIERALATTLVEDQPCTVELLTLPDGLTSAAEIDATQHATDELLYILAGSVTVRVHDAHGEFLADEFLFLPSVVSYRLTLSARSSAIRILIGHQPRRD